MFNWNLVIDFTPFSDFDGNNLLFAVWLLLIILPTLGKFEGFGVKVQSPFDAPLEKKVDELKATKPHNIEEIELELGKLTGKRAENSEE